MTICWRRRLEYGQARVDIGHSNTCIKRMHRNQYRLHDDDNHNNNHVCTKQILYEFLDN